MVNVFGMLEVSLMTYLDDLPVCFLMVPTMNILPYNQNIACNAEYI